MPIWICKMAVARACCVDERKDLSGEKCHAACGKAERNYKKPYDKMCQPHGSDKTVKSKGNKTGRGY